MARYAIEHKQYEGRAWMRDTQRTYRTRNQAIIAADAMAAHYNTPKRVVDTQKADAVVIVLGDTAEWEAEAVRFEAALARFDAKPVRTPSEQRAIELQQSAAYWAQRQQVARNMASGAWGEALHLYRYEALECQRMAASYASQARSIITD